MDEERKKTDTFFYVDCTMFGYLYFRMPEPVS